MNSNICVLQNILPVGPKQPYDNAGGGIEGLGDGRDAEDSESKSEVGCVNEVERTSIWGSILVFFDISTLGIDSMIREEEEL